MVHARPPITRHPPIFPLRFFTELRDRRIIQIVASYAAAAWIGLEVVDQLVDRGILPDWVYLILLVWFLGGFAAAAVVGWYHGEKGAQEVTRPEIALLVFIVLGTVGATGLTVRDYREGLAVADALDAATGLDARRVAVLYFEDGSGGELSYLADGLTEDLIAELETVDGLDVVSRNGTAQYRGSDRAPDAIARELDAGTYVEGYVERRGENVRIGVALVDAESGATIERGSFERPVGAVSELRAGLTDEVSRLLRTWLGEEVRVRARRAETASDAAWVLVQRAERAWKDGDALLLDDDWEGANAAWNRADDLLRQASEVSSAWPEPVVQRARLAYERSRLEDDPRAMAEMMSDARTLAERGLALDPRNADALEVRGIVTYLRYLFAMEPDRALAEQLLVDAEADLRAATRVNPLQANAWNVLGHLYYQLDDIVEANLAARRAYEADAFLSAAPDILWRLWSTSYDLENRPQARQWCGEGRDRFPANPRFYECGIWNMTSGAADPDPDSAWTLYRQVMERTPEHSADFATLQTRVLVAAAIGRRATEDGDGVLADSARSVLRTSRGDASLDPGRDLLVTQAFAYTLLDDSEQAVDLLQEYLTFNPDRREGFTEHGHWWWRELRGHPAFRRITGS